MMKLLADRAQCTKCEKGYNRPSRPPCVGESGRTQGCRQRERHGKRPPNHREGTVALLERAREAVRERVRYERHEDHQ
jgi:hypothetical protein